MDFYEALEKLYEIQSVNLPKTNNPNDTKKVLDAVAKKNLELKNKKKIIKNYDPKTGKAMVDTRTYLDDKADISLSKIRI